MRVPLVPLVLLALGGCATLSRPDAWVAVAPYVAPQPLARRILLSVRGRPFLADFDRSMTVGPGRLTLRFTRARLDGARDVLLLRLVPGRCQTAIRARAWHEDLHHRHLPDPYIAGSLDALVSVVKAAAGLRVAAADPPPRPARP